MESPFFTSGRILLASIALTSCAVIKPSTVSLEAECGQWLNESSSPPNCGPWIEQRRSELRSQREQAEAERQAAAVQYQKEQNALLQKQQQERARIETEATQNDEQQGFKHISFEDFALDSAQMKGKRVAIRGFYVEDGWRLIRDPLSVARWLELAEDSPSSNIPLHIDKATRDARKSLFACSGASRPLGCEMVIRGRVESLTLQNRLGVKWQAVGIVVESVRP